MINKNLFQSTFKTLILLMLFIVVGLFFDSAYFIEINQNGQVYANCILIIVFFWMFYRATNRFKELMIYAVAIGIAGECLFSLGFDMYEYRLNNVPFYIPPGHAILYIVTAYFCREKYVKIYRNQLELGFGIFIFLYSLCYLIFAADIFGFGLTLLTLWLLKSRPKERLFFYTMYLVVAFLEIIGTSYHCWKWPDTAFGIFDILKSANPPSGISFFYFGLDLGCLWLYKQRHLIAWKRMRRIG